jgi:hypothetical protein
MVIYPNCVFDFLRLRVMNIENHLDNHRVLFLFLITTFVILYTEFFFHVLYFVVNSLLIEGLKIRGHSSSF